MKVFLSWSGNPSKELAEAFRKWLPGVLQAVRPYYTPDDITKGARWSAEIAKELEECKIGVIFLTRDNLNAPWIMFEAGALSKKLDKANVCPFLFGIEASDIQGPLVQFQAARFDKNEVKRVVKMMNGQLGESALVPDVLESVYEMWWPKLEKDANEILAKQGTGKPSAVRSERELIEEVLDLTRVLSVVVTREKATKGLNPAPIVDIIGKLVDLASQMKATGVFNAQRQILFELVEPVNSLIGRLNANEINLKALDDSLRQVRLDLKAASPFKETKEADDVPF